MKKGLLFGSLTILALTVGFFVQNESVKCTKDYQPRVTAKKNVVF